MITYIIIHIHYRVLARTLFGPVECPFSIEFTKLHFPYWVYTNNKIIFFLVYVKVFLICNIFGLLSHVPFLGICVLVLALLCSIMLFMLRQPFLAAQKILCFFSCYFNHLNGKEHIRNYKRKCFRRVCFHILRKLTSRVKQEKKSYLFSKSF